MEKIAVSERESLQPLEQIASQENFAKFAYPFFVKISSSISIGIKAARANLIPGLIVQSLMLALALAYYFHPRTHEILTHLAQLKQDYDLPISFIAAAIAGGLLPELLVVSVFQKGIPALRNLKNLAFTLPLWGICGILVDLFYRLQAQMFGNDAGVETIVKKVLVDQFIYTPLIATTITLIAYEWRNHGYRLRAIRVFWSREFFESKTLPTLIANWAVWIPLVCIIYSLPLPLQFPMFSLALTFWVMIFTFISGKPDHQPPPAGVFPLANREV